MDFLLFGLAFALVPNASLRYNINLYKTRPFREISVSSSSLFKLQAGYGMSYAQEQAVSSMCRQLEQKQRCQTLLGVTGSGKTFSMANIIQETGRPAVIMAPNKTLAAQLFSEMKGFFPKNAVEYFVSYYDYYQPEAYVPSSDTFIEKDASINEHIEQMRLSATKALIERDDAIIVATVSAIYGLGDPESYLKMVLHLSVGDQVGQRAIIRRLVELQYKREAMVLERSSFRVRGDVVDVYPAEHENRAVRIALFDDEVESLTEFDPLTGATLRKLVRFTFYPKTHYVTPKDRLLQTVDLIKEELSERVAYFRSVDKLLEAQRIDQRCRYDIEMMLELGYCSGIENYSRYLSTRSPGQAPPTLLDYCPSNTLLMLDESHVTVPQVGAMYAGDRARKMNLVEYGFRLPSALDNRPLKFSEFEAMGLQTLFVSATPGKYEAEHANAVVELVVRPTGLLDPHVEVRSANSQVDNLYGEIRTVVASGQRVLVTTLTKKMSEQLTEYLHEKGVKVRYLHSSIDTVERVEILRDLRLGVFDVLVGINLLREGLDLPEVELVAVLDADKEGFLRSTTSLVQTIGRAARNIKGRVILYANTITRSMKQAMDETDRRREIQHDYNKEHGITPSAIKKAVKDILNVAVADESNMLTTDALGQEEVALKSDEDKQKLIKKLTDKMKSCAQDLRFEEASSLRDEITRIKKTLY